MLTPDADLLKTYEAELQAARKNQEFLTSLYEECRNLNASLLNEVITLHNVVTAKDEELRRLNHTLQLLQR